MLPKIQKLIHNTRAIFKIDSKPTEGSNNLVTSGGIYDYVADAKKNVRYIMIPITSDKDSGTATFNAGGSAEDVVYKVQEGLLVMLTDYRTGQCFTPTNRFIAEEGQTFDAVTFTSYYNGIIYSIVIEQGEGAQYFVSYDELDISAMIWNAINEDNG